MMKKMETKNKNGSTAIEKILRQMPVVISVMVILLVSVGSVYVAPVASIENLSVTTVEVAIDDPTTDPVDFRTVEYAIFRTMSPLMRITLYPNINVTAGEFQVIIDDGEDDTEDWLDISELFAFSDSNATANIPEIVPINTFPGPNQETFRALFTDSSQVRVMYLGENRLRFFLFGEEKFVANFLHYDAFDKTVVGINDGTEPIPGDSYGNEMMTNHIILNFDSNISDTDISAFLFYETLRPQGITRDLGVVQTRELEWLSGAALLARIAELDAALGPEPDDAHIDLLPGNPTISSEHYPPAFNGDFRAASGDWSPNGRRDQYQHFVMQTFPAHRLIDLTKDVGTTVRVSMHGYGVAAGNDFSGPAANNPNTYFVRGNRMFQATDILEPGKVISAQPSDNGNPNVGNITNVADLQVGEGHDTAVMAILAGDGMGNQIGGADRNINQIQLGTGKDVQVRIVRWRNSNLAYYKQLELSRDDRNTRIHLIERSYSSSNVPAAPVRNNLIARYRAISNNGKLIVGAAWNENGDVANCDAGRCGPDHNTPRKDLAGNNAFKKNVLVIGATERILNPNILETKASFSNRGEEISVVAPGRRIHSVNPAGNFRYFDGTSFATPSVAGIAAELMLVDPTLQEAAHIVKVAEIMEATADDIEAAGRDNNAGHGRVNFWKAVLSAANKGLSTEGRTDGGDGNDNFFKNLPLKKEAATTWYGFEIRTCVKNAVVWLRKNDGSYVKVEDGGASVPDLTAQGVPKNTVAAYVSAQPYKKANGRILPSLPFSKAELNAVPFNQYFVARFSIKRDQLLDKDRLAIFRPGADPNTDKKEKPIALLPLDLDEMRKAQASSNTIIKRYVQEFDDFVFHILFPVADYGDARDPKYPTLKGNKGASHCDYTKEWLGDREDPRPSVGPEHDADDPNDPDGVPNIKKASEHVDADFYDDGVTFYPLTYVPGGTGKVDFIVNTANAHGGRYKNKPDSLIYINAWIDWNTDGKWDGPKEHIIKGKTVNPADFPAGTNKKKFTESFDVPAIGKGEIWARFRLDYGENAGQTPTLPHHPDLDKFKGPAQYGEVEDYRIGADFGDAPDPKYPSRLASNGARHSVFAFEWLGEDVNGELDSKQVDLDEFDDGVTFYPPYKKGVQNKVDVVISTSGLGAARYGAVANKKLYLNAWFDWNSNGNWEAGELTISKDYDPSTWGGAKSKKVTINFIPLAAQPKKMWARFRLDYGENVKTTTGQAKFGEVEDYKVSKRRSTANQIVSGDTIYIGEEGLVFDVDGDGDYGEAGTPDVGDLEGVPGTITTGAPPLHLSTTYTVPEVTEGKYYYDANGNGELDTGEFYIYVGTVEITGDIILNTAAQDSIVGKSVPTSAEIVFKAEMNFGGKIPNSDFKIVVTDPDGVVIETIDGQSLTNLDATLGTTIYVGNGTVGGTTTAPQYADAMDLTDMKTGTYKVKIKTEKTDCNMLDISSSEMEFTIRSEEVMIEAMEDTIGVGEDMVLKANGNPKDWYYLIVTGIKRVGTAPSVAPEIKDTEDVKARDAAGDAYPKTATELVETNLAAWIQTGSDGVADVKIDTTDADDRTYTIKVYEVPDPTGVVGFLHPMTVGAAAATFVPDDDVSDVATDDDEVKVKVEEAKVTFDIPTSVIIGEEIDIKGSITAGDRIDLIIKDHEVIADDEPVDEDNEFEMKWDTSGYTTGSYTIEGYIDFRVGGAAEVLDDFDDEDDDGKTTIRLVEPGLTAKQLRNVVAAEDDDYVFEGTATGVDDVDYILIGPKGWKSGTVASLVNGIMVSSTSVSNNEFSEEETMTANLDTGMWIALILAPGRDGWYETNNAAEAGGLTAFSFDPDLVDGKNQDQCVAIIKDQTSESVGSDDLLVEFTFKVESPRVDLDPIESVAVGEPLYVSGTTNREPETMITISTIGPVELCPVCVMVEWPTPDGGVFNATIDTSEAVRGTYTIEADDGDGYIDTAIVEIVTAVPTSEP